MLSQPGQITCLKTVNHREPEMLFGLFLDTIATFKVERKTVTKGMLYKNMNKLLNGQPVESACDRNSVFHEINLNQQKIRDKNKFGRRIPLHFTQGLLQNTITSISHSW